MKLKVGDIVRIKMDLVVGKRYNVNKSDSGCLFAEKMKTFIGCITTITNLTLNKNRYNLEISGRAWVWTDDMIELYIHDEEKVIKLNASPERINALNNIINKILKI